VLLRIWGKLLRSVVLREQSHVSSALPHACDVITVINPLRRLLAGVVLPILVGVSRILKDSNYPHDELLFPRVAPASEMRGGGQARPTPSLH
jgi:hypothetical protein